MFCLKEQDLGGGFLLQRESEYSGKGGQREDPYRAEGTSSSPKIRQSQGPEGKRGKTESSPAGRAMAFIGKVGGLWLQFESFVEVKGRNSTFLHLRMRGGGVVCGEGGTEPCPDWKEKLLTGREKEGSGKRKKKNFCEPRIRN